MNTCETSVMWQTMAQSHSRASTLTLFSVSTVRFRRFRHFGLSRLRRMIVNNKTLQQWTCTRLIRGHPTVYLLLYPPYCEISSTAVRVIWSEGGRFDKGKLRASTNCYLEIETTKTIVRTLNQVEEDEADKTMTACRFGSTVRLRLSLMVIKLNDCASSPACNVLQQVRRHIQRVG